MAPFVRRQYGDELYDVMREVKRLCDPGGVLAPGIVVGDDDTIHVRHLKPVERVEAEVDRCVECGFCEGVCPSRDLTLTPRQRIVLRRERAAAEGRGDAALVAEIERDYAYDGVDTCAVDGMCQTACPVRIDTGALVARLRAEDAGRVAAAGWRAAAARWSVLTTAASVGLSAADRLPARLVTGATDAARLVADDDAMPRWTPDLPTGGRRRRHRPTSTPDAVFFPTCLSSLFAPEGDGRGSSEALLALAERAGVSLLVPDGIADLCCGTPWKSKGMTAGHEAMVRGLAETLWTATRHGALPIVCDASSCTEGCGTRWPRLVPTCGSWTP